MGCFFVLICIFYAAGLGMLVFGLWSAKRSQSAGNWPTTPGTLTRVHMEESSDSESTSYQVRVQYTYAVDNKTYEGDQLAFGYGSSSGEAAHREIYDKLKRAKQVMVRYDPEHPAVSCLSYGMHRMITFIFVFSIMWLVFTTGFAILWWLMMQSDHVLLKHLEVL